VSWLLGVPVVVALAVGFALRSVRGRYVVVTVQGVSMAPTLVDGDRVVVRRRSATQVRPGDVVVLEPPADAAAGPDPLRWNIKRVVAVAGDPVPDGVPVEGIDRVPAGSLVVFGDNPDSVDSRQRGLFEASRLLGVAVRRLGGRRL
jgi:signal peptidase I